jgi:transposase
MKIIGCDYHPSFQTIAVYDSQTEQTSVYTLLHACGDAEGFYGGLKESAKIGLESCGNTLWFERLVVGLGHELKIGDAATIGRLAGREPKTNERDARHILALLRDGRFPEIARPRLEQRDLRQLVLHRHKLVQMRTRVMNELQHLALNQGLQLGRRLWTNAGQARFQALVLDPWAAQRRSDLQQLHQELNQKIAPLTEAIERQARQRAEVKLLMTHPGVGPITALVFVLTLLRADRFPRSKQVASYLGLVPRERSSGTRQRLGSITKQGNPMMRALLVEAGQSAARWDPELRQDYARLAHKKNRSIAKVMVARKLAVRLYWMLKTQQPYTRAGSHAGQPESSCGRRKRPTA